MFTSHILKKLKNFFNCFFLNLFNFNIKITIFNIYCVFLTNETFIDYKKQKLDQ